MTKKVDWVAMADGVVWGSFLSMFALKSLGLTDLSWWIVFSPMVVFVAAWLVIGAIGIWALTKIGR